MPNCSYWYGIVPSLTPTCNPEGVDILLTCGVYVPHEPPTTVRWFFTPENSTSTITIFESSDKYDLTLTLGSTPVQGGNVSGLSGLFYDQYVLEIKQFAMNDSGYYWCQIEVNSTEISLTFLPSQYGYLTPNSAQTCTSSLHYFDLLNPPICATANIPMSSTFSFSSSMTQHQTVFLSTAITRSLSLIHSSTSIAHLEPSTQLQTNTQIQPSKLHTQFQPSRTYTQLQPSKTYTQLQSSGTKQQLQPSQTVTNSRDDSNNVVVYIVVMIGIELALFAITCTLSAVFAVILMQTKKWSTKGW